MSDVVELGSLFAKPGKPAPASAAPASGSVVDIGTLFGKPPAETAAPAKPPEDPTSLGRLARDSAMNIAAFADMVLSLPGQAVGLGADMGMRARAAAKGIDRRTAAQMAAKFGQEVADPLSNPLRKLMGLFGYGDSYDASDVVKVMDKASGMIAAGGEWVEKNTNGALLKEDVMSLTNALMTAAGGRGTAYVVDPKLEAMGKYKGPLAPQKDAGKPGGNSPQGPDSYGPKVEDVGPAPEAAAADSSAYLAWLDRKQNTTNVANLDKIRNAEQRAYDLMQRGAGKAEVDRMVARDPLLGEALAAVRARRGQAAEASSGAFVGGVEADIVGQPKHRLHPGPTPQWNAQEALMDVPDVAKPDGPVKRNFPIAPLAVGGVAAGAAAYEYLQGGDARDSAIAAGAALTLADLGKMSAATPLSAILERSEYSLKTFDRLPQNRFEFTREQVMQQLNRPDVSKAEKDIVLQVLGDREKISAQELMTRFKEVTGDFELKGKEVSDYADYGLNSINRDRREITDPDSGDVYTSNEREVPSRTTIYQSPIELGDANHFGDPNYFAHTRSFDEGGVRHVVEIQSDAVQRAKPPLTPERVAELETEYKSLIAERDKLKAMLAEAETPGRNSEMLQRISTMPEFADAWRPDENHAAWVIQRKLDPIKGRLEEMQSTLTPRNSPTRRAEVEALRDEALARADFMDGVDAAAAKAVMNNYERAADFQPSEVIGPLMESAPSGVLKRLKARMTSALGYSQSLAEGNFKYVLRVADEAVAKNPQAGWRRIYNAIQQAAVEYRVAVAEANAKLASGSDPEAVRPMFKDWYKRIIREELDAAAKAREARLKSDADLEADIKLYQEGIKRGDPEFIGANAYVDDLIRQRGVWEGKRDVPVPADTVRFATADTVAKVEGWPDQREAARAQLGDPFYNAEGQARLARDAESGPRFNPHHQGIYDRYKKDIEKFLTKDLGGKPFTDDKGHTWIEVPLPKRSTTGRPGGPKQMMGFADPKLLAGIAAVGGGLALAASWDELNGAAKTAGAAAIIGLGVLAAGRSGVLADWAKVAGATAEKTIGNISAEVRTMSPELLRRWTRFEWQSLVRQHKATQAAAPFINTLNALPEAQKRALGLAALTGKEAEVLRVLREVGKPELVTQWRAVRAELDALGGELKAAGLLKNLRRDYFPRVVTDIDGLLEAVGRESGDFLEQKLSAANRASIAKTGDPLSQLEASILINKHLEEAIRRGTGGGGKAGFLKKRSIEDIGEALLPFYASPAESLALYMRSASRQIERAKFFGKNLVRDAETGLTNIDDSIGRVVNEVGGKLNRAQRERLEELLRTRFGPGERSADRVTQAYRNVVQGALLGNPFSAIGQLADVGVTAAMHGTMPTIKALWQTVQEARASARGTGRGEAGRFNLDDMGLVDRIADEFVTPVRNPLIVRGIEISTANFADKALKWSGFNFTDEFGKLVNMNAAANGLRAKARTAAGRAELAVRYGEYFGTDMPKLLEDLAAGRKTQLVGEAVFRELSDVQPLTKLEMPQAYVGNPSMRFLYTMKSWMIKQMNLVRERGVREMASGDLTRARRGAEFLLRYATLAGMAGATVEMIRNWLMGRGAEMEWGDVPENVLKTFGFGSYVRDKIAQGKPVEAIGGTVLPPYKLFDDILRGDPGAIQYVPVVGKFIWEHSEERQKKLEERKKREEGKARREEERKRYGEESVR